MISTHQHNVTERFERVQQEMNTAQRQRVLLQWDLDSQNSRNASSEGPENDIEGFEIEQRLRQQLQNMSSQISELEAQLTEVELPPDYVSSM
jgi:chaperonin cofactor prefoldin